MQKAVTIRSDYVDDLPLMLAPCQICNKFHITGLHGPSQMQARSDKQMEVAVLYGGSCSQLPTELGTASRQTLLNKTSGLLYSARPFIAQVFTTCLAPHLEQGHTEQSTAAVTRLGYRLSSLGSSWCSSGPPVTGYRKTSHKE
jgi:hypothetical protein